MYPRRIVIMVFAFSGLGLGSLFLLGGCGGDSTTTGTQLQISPEVKAELEDMKATQKEIMAERKAKMGKKKKQ